MASPKSFSHRELQRHGRSSLRVSLPVDKLREHDVYRSDRVGAEYSESAGELLIDLEADPADCDLSLLIAPVGDALGVTIPAPIRHDHGLTDDDGVTTLPAGEATIAVSL